MLALQTGLRNRPPREAAQLNPTAGPQGAGKSVLGCVLCDPGPDPWPTHDIKTPPGMLVCQRPSIRLLRRKFLVCSKRESLRSQSHSPWSSHIIVVPKPDCSPHLCNDVRKLNAVSDSYTLTGHRVYSLVKRLGKTRFISTLDLTKSYWRVPLTTDAWQKTAFSFASGHLQYWVLPFGLHGAPPLCSHLP